MMRSKPTLMVIPQTQAGESTNHDHEEGSELGSYLFCKHRYLDTHLFFS